MTSIAWFRCVFYFTLFGFFELDLYSAGIRLALISLVATIVESLPITTRLDDNFTVPATTFLLGIVFFPLPSWENVDAMVYIHWRTRTRWNLWRKELSGRRSLSSIPFVFRLHTNLFKLFVLCIWMKSKLMKNWIRLDEIVGKNRKIHQDWSLWLLYVWFEFLLFTTLENKICKYQFALFPSVAVAHIKVLF